MTRMNVKSAVVSFRCNLVDRDYTQGITRCQGANGAEAYPWLQAWLEFSRVATQTAWPSVSVKV